MAKATTRFAGVYKKIYAKTKETKYYYSIKVKQDDNSFKTIKSPAKFDNPYACYDELLKVKSGDFIPEVNVKKEKPKSIFLDKIKEEKEKKLLNRSYYSNSSLKALGEQHLKAYSLKNRKSSLAIHKWALNHYIYKFFKEETLMSNVCKNERLIAFREFLGNQEQLCVNRKNKVITCLKQVIERAFNLGVISQKEFGLFNLNVPRFDEKDVVKKENTSKQFYTVKEFQQFISVIDNDFWKLAFKVLFYGGFRQGEFLGITVADVKSDYRIYINKQVDEFGNVQPVKNKNGCRYTLIKKEVYNDILEYIEKYDLKENDRLFPTTRERISVYNKKYAELSNLPKIKPHAFRHSSCSYLFQVYIDNNLVPNFQFIANNLGDTIATVQQYYSHLYESESDKMLDLI